MPSKPQADDKTGGTPDEGRMAPGAEGRGGCRIQRRPEIHAEPSKTLAKLIKQAEAVTSFMGHEAVLWFVDKTGTAGQMRCQKCRKACGVAEAPMRGKDNINGFLAEEKCAVA